MYKIDLTPYVRAEVIDIQHPDCEVTKQILVDTNVLYFLYYDRFSLLAVLGEGARDYQLREYSSFFKKLLSSGANLFVHKVCLCELAHRVELAEQKIFFCELNKLAEFDDKNFNIKEMRHGYYKKFEEIKGRLLAYFNVISKTFKLLNVDIPLDRFLADFLYEWKDSIGSAGDSMMIAEAKRAGIDSVLSDDSDFISFDGIKLYTANNKAIKVYNRRLKSAP
jgi:predicted nucleic acid-binding protein